MVDLEWGLIFIKRYNSTYKKSSNMFDEAETLQYPVNTCHDDFGITFENTRFGAGVKGLFFFNRIGNKWKSKGMDIIILTNNRFL